MKLFFSFYQSRNSLLGFQGLMGWLLLTSLQIRASHYSHCLFLQLPSDALGHVLQHPDAARDQLQLLILLFHNQLVPEKRK